jgi:hypothetical protein
VWKVSSRVANGARLAEWGGGRCRATSKSLAVAPAPFVFQKKKERRSFLKDESGLTNPI